MPTKTKPEFLVSKQRFEEFDVIFNNPEHVTCLWGIVYNKNDWYSKMFAKQFSFLAIDSDHEFLKIVNHHEARKYAAEHFVE